eukprot:1970755-Pyramimonas_sp.AAC.1
MASLSQSVMDTFALMPSVVHSTEEGLGWVLAVVAALACTFVLSHPPGPPLLPERSCSRAVL